MVNDYDYVYLYDYDFMKFINCLQNYKFWLFQDAVYSFSKVIIVFLISIFCKSTLLISLFSFVRNSFIFSAQYFSPLSNGMVSHKPMLTSGGTFSEMKHFITPLLLTEFYCITQAPIIMLQTSTLTENYHLQTS